MKKSTLLFAAFFAGILFSSAQNQVIYNYTGGPQIFVVPSSCVSSITVDVQGAQGGGTGGMGGSVTGNLPVSPGDTLRIYVGGQGGPEMSQSVGGYNGGGTAGMVQTQYPGAGGGGASDIRFGGISLNNRIVVAGGGGGSHQINGPNDAGAGGGLIGGPANNNGNSCMATWADGGTQTTGGNPSTWSGSCCQFTVVPGGSFGIGGDGAGPAISCNGGDGGAGGGGGWYGGGGGGTYTAGAGGSSYTAGTVTSVVHLQGVRAGNGQVIITMNAPYVNLGPDTAICGTSVILNAQNPNCTYLWSTGATTQTIVVTNPGSYFVTVTDISSCTHSDTVALTFSTVPTVTFTLTPTFVCYTAPSFVLTGGSPPGGTYSGTGVSSGQFIPTLAGPGTHTITYTYSNGCTAAATQQITVAPWITVALGPDVTQCGGTVTLNAGNTGYNFLWSNSATTQSIVVTTTGTYSVVVTNPTNGCTGTDVIVITIGTVPNVNLALGQSTCCVTDPIFTLTGGTPPGGTYTGPGVSAGNFNPAAAGVGGHLIVYTYSNGCQGQDAQWMTVTTCPGMAEYTWSYGDVSIFPNPASQSLNISVSATLKEMHVELMDLKGDKVRDAQTGTVNPGNPFKMDVSDLPAGLYLVRIVSGNEQILRKVIVQK